MAASEKPWTMCFLRIGEKGKQQLGDEFLNDFRACEETPKVEQLPSVRKRM